MNVTRGIIAALIWALAGVIVPIVLVVGYTVVTWQFDNTPEFDRNYAIAWWRMRAVPPLVGVPIYLGLTAWATYTPKRKHGFAKTLVIIFFTAIPLTWFLGALEFTPKRYKGIEHPDMYVSEFLLLLLPPLIISCILTAVRSTDSRHVDTAEEGQPDGKSNATAT